MYTNSENKKAKTEDTLIMMPDKRLTDAECPMGHKIEVV